MKQNQFTMEIPKEVAERFYRGFLRRIENMTYEEAERELPYVAFDEFKRIYPERCPSEVNEIEVKKIMPEQLELPKSKAKSKRDDSLQPGLF
jgi:hypothetical protein